MSDDNPKIDTATLLADIKKKANKSAALEVAPEVSVVESATPNADKLLASVIAPVVTPAPVESVAEYQQYTSSRVSTCLITPTGKRINFSSYQYYTKDPEIVAYLDAEISRGLIGFIKGKMLAAAELDPEAAKKREIIEEFKASQEGRDFGGTKPKSEQSTALSSDHVAN